MTEQALWGLLLIAYIVPFWLWQVSAHNSIETRKKLYPGRENERQLERQLINRSLLWSAGLVVLLAAWMVGMRPVGAGIILSATAFLVFLARIAQMRWNLLSNKLFRIWLAGSAVWVAAIGGWYLVFSRVGELRDEEYLFLALTLPVLFAVSIAAWRWAVRKT